MFKNHFLQRVAVAWLLVLATAMVLAACGGAATPAESVEPDAADDSQAEIAEEEADATEEVEEVAEATATTEEVEATEEVVVEQEQAIVASPPASCEPIDIPDNDLIPAPMADDWAKGPETASITVIEYGDFQ